MRKPSNPPPRLDAVRELLGSSQRKFVPVRKSFTQAKTESGDSAPGPLAGLVTRGVVSALDQYLLLHSRAAGRPEEDGGLAWDVTLSSRVWARLLGLHEGPSGRRTVGRNWAALRDLKLVSTEPSGRKTAVTLLREDGSGEPYSHPTETGDPYLKIPYSFWLEGHASGLKLPGMAMVVIACSLADWFALPFDKGPEWYGIGSSTVERGLRELKRAGLIEADYVWRSTPLSESGWTKDQRYRLMPPLGPSGKVAKGAPKALLARSSTASPPSKRGASESADSVRRASRKGS